MTSKSINGIECMLYINVLSNSKFSSNLITWGSGNLPRQIFSVGRETWARTKTSPVWATPFVSQPFHNEDVAVHRLQFQYKYKCKLVENLKLLFLTNRSKMQNLWRPLHFPFLNLLHSPWHWSTWIFYQFLTPFCLSSLLCALTWFPMTCGKFLLTTEYNLDQRHKSLFP
jgi:hypothetical protein